MKKTTVLILDDSYLFRELLHHEIERDVNISVIAKATDPYEARDKIIEFKPDILISDVHMDKMNGLEFVKKLLPQYSMPVIMMSSDSSMRKEAESINTVSFLQKPSGGQCENDLFFRNVISKIKQIVSSDPYGHSINSYYSKLIVIGSSTGGAEAIEKTLTSLPAVMPPIVVAQHMPARFTKTFSERLNSHVALSVKEAEKGDVLIPGQVYISPGGFHTRIKKSDSRYIIHCEENITGMQICPCINFLFDSAVPAGNNAIGVLLTGMGKDGADGLLNMRNAGSKTIGQDEKTSIVYGMPKVAFDKGAVCYQLPLDKIAQKIIALSNS